jgi:DNA polymerase-4
MYVDMNSYFASCEQQDFPELRGKPIGVCAGSHPTAAIIAPSIEAKRFGVKTGMRLNDARVICPQIMPVNGRPYRYRQIHVDIMHVLQSYCAEAKARSIDEAVMDLTSYRWVYPDAKELARKIKADIKAKHDFLTCSIGIAPNSYLSKIGTELQKPDGLIEITRENIDEHFARLHLTDLTGIAKANERRLKLIGINTPVEMRQASAALLRKAFGGIVGHYWYCRLNFMEMDSYENPYRSMSTGRTLSREQRESKQKMQSLLISLCTRLEQRMVKQKVFCKELSFYIRYKDASSWDFNMKFTTPLQDAVDLRKYVEHKIQEFETSHNITTIFTEKTHHFGIVIKNFIEARYVTYTLFENKMRQDKLRLVMYDIKDRFGRDKVRKASETISPGEMADAIGFGSVKDVQTNNYLLEE